MICPKCNQPALQLRTNRPGSTRFPKDLTGLNAVLRWYLCKSSSCNTRFRSLEILEEVFDQLKKPAAAIQRSPNVRPTN